MWCDFHARVIKKVFEELIAAEIRWIIIGDYLGLPERNNSKDIDIVVEKSQISCANVIISRVLQRSGFNYYEKERFENIWATTYYLNNGTENIFSIKIDVLYAIVWRGAIIFDCNKLLDNASEYNGFPVPNRPMNGFILWIKPLITGGYVKGKYRSAIVDAIAAYPEEFAAILKQTFGTSLYSKVLPLLKEHDFDGTVKFKRRIRSTVWVKAFISSPLVTTVATIEHFLRTFLIRAKRRRATMFAVVGPDGVGKTTFIDCLGKEIARILVRDRKDVLFAHFRPNIFPNIKSLLLRSKYNASSECFSNPHRARPANGLSSFFRLAYYWLDYVLGYWLRVRHMCIHGKIYIFDRYFYDFIVDPRRSRIHLPNWIRRTFLAITPQPDLIFFLDCDADVVFSRKQELTRTEIERQLNEYRRLTEAFPQLFIRLDAQQVPEALCHQALEQIIERSFLPLLDADASS